MLNLGIVPVTPLQDEDDVYLDNLISCTENAFAYYDAIMGFDDDEVESMEGLSAERRRMIKEQMKKQIQSAKQKISDTGSSLKDSLSSILKSSTSFLENTANAIKRAPIGRLNKQLNDLSKNKNAVDSYKVKVLSVWLSVIMSKGEKDWQKVERSFVSRMKSGKPSKQEPYAKDATRVQAISVVTNLVGTEIEYIKRIYSFLLKLDGKSDTTVINAVRRFLASDYGSSATNKQIWQKVQQAQNKEQMIKAIKQVMKHYRDKMHCIHMWITYARNFQKECAKDTGNPGTSIVKTFLMPAGVKREMEQLVKRYTGAKGSWRPKLKRVIVSSYKLSNMVFDGMTLEHRPKGIKDSGGNYVATKPSGRSISSVVIFPQVVLAQGIIPLASLILHEVYHTIDLAKKSKQGKEWKRQQQWDQQRSEYTTQSEEIRAYRTQYQFVADVVDGNVPRTSAILTWVKDIKRQVTEEAKKVGFKPDDPYDPKQRRDSMRSILEAGRTIREQRTNKKA